LSLSRCSPTRVWIPCVAIDPDRLGLGVDPARTRWRHGQPRPCRGSTVHLCLLGCLRGSGCNPFSPLWTDGVVARAQLDWGGGEPAGGRRCCPHRPPPVGAGGRPRHRTSRRRPLPRCTGRHARRSPSLWRGAPFPCAHGTSPYGVASGAPAAALHSTSAIPAPSRLAARVADRPGAVHVGAGGCRRRGGPCGARRSAAARLPRLGAPPRRTAAATRGGALPTRWRRERGGRCRGTSGAGTVVGRLCGRRARNDGRCGWPRRRPPARWPSSWGRRADAPRCWWPTAHWVGKGGGVRGEGHSSHGRGGSPWGRTEVVSATIVAWTLDGGHPLAPRPRFLCSAALHTGGLRQL